MTLEEWRTAHRLTRREAADMLNVTPSYYHRLELGHLWPEFDRMQLIVSRTGGKVQPNDLFAMRLALQFT